MVSVSRWILAAGFLAGAAVAATQPAHAVPITQGDVLNLSLSGTVSGTSLATSGTLSVQTLSTTQLVLDIELTNTTPGATPGDNRMVSFGFDISGTRTLNSGSGNSGWSASVNNVNITGGNRVDVCAWEGSNCTGGANQGIFEGDTESFTLTLLGTFDPTTIGLEGFLGRYQSIGATGASGTIPGTATPGGGNPPPAVPEPATFSLLGFGLTGLGTLLYSRRRRQIA